MPAGRARRKSGGFPGAAPGRPGRANEAPAVLF